VVDGVDVGLVQLVHGSRKQAANGIVDASETNQFDALRIVEGKDTGHELFSYGVKGLKDRLETSRGEMSRRSSHPQTRSAGGRRVS
jgi:hypothetical protein